MVITSENHNFLDKATLLNETNKFTDKGHNMVTTEHDLFLKTLQWKETETIKQSRELSVCGINVKTFKVWNRRLEVKSRVSAKMFW